MSVLDDWLSEKETAAAVNKTVRTLRQWRKKGIGPPYSRFGQTIKYRRTALVEHFKAIEVKPVRNRVTANSPE